MIRSDVPVPVSTRCPVSVASRLPAGFTPAPVSRSPISFQAALAQSHAGGYLCRASVGASLHRYPTGRGKAPGTICILVARNAANDGSGFYLAGIPRPWYQGPVPEVHTTNRRHGSERCKRCRAILLSPYIRLIRETRTSANAGPFLLVNQGFFASTPAWRNASARRSRPSTASTCCCSRERAISSKCARDGPSLRIASGTDRST